MDHNTSSTLVRGVNWTHKTTGKRITIVSIDYKWVVFRDLESRITARERKPTFLEQYGPDIQAETITDYDTTG